MISEQIEPIDRQIALWVGNSLTKEEQRREFAVMAIQQNAITLAANALILGRNLIVKRFVDGVLARSEYDVRDNGTIVYEYPILDSALQFIRDELEKMSPYRSGAYQRSHTLFIDGAESSIDQTALATAQEYMFVSTLPYARKIEEGESSQAPDGVYEITAQRARAKFGDVGRIEFVDYTGVYGVMAQTPRATYGRNTTTQMNRSVHRYPAIRVTVN